MAQAANRFHTEVVERKLEKTPYIDKQKNLTHNYLDNITRMRSEYFHGN